MVGWAKRQQILIKSGGTVTDQLAPFVALHPGRIFRVGQILTHTGRRSHLKIQRKVQLLREVYSTLLLVSISFTVEIVGAGKTCQARRPHE